jgi:hypothetical protein
MSGKFDALAAKVGSKELAGWITNHVAPVKARADATRAKRKKKAVDIMRGGK